MTKIEKEKYRHDLESLVTNESNTLQFTFESLFKENSEFYNLELHKDSGTMVISDKVTNKEYEGTYTLEYKNGCRIKLAFYDLNDIFSRVIGYDKNGNVTYSNSLDMTIKFLRGLPGTEKKLEFH